jgi:hypothetical protein
LNISEEFVQDFLGRHDTQVFARSVECDVMIKSSGFLKGQDPVMAESSTPVRHKLGSSPPANREHSVANGHPARPIAEIALPIASKDLSLPLAINSFQATEGFALTFLAASQT